MRPALALKSELSARMIVAKTIFSDEPIRGYIAHIESIVNHTRMPWLVDSIQLIPMKPKGSLKYAFLDTVPIRLEIRSFTRDERHLYLMDIFYQKRFFSNKTSNENHSNFASLEVAWVSFVENVNADPIVWFAAFEAEREQFFDRSLIGKKMKIHIMCLKANIPCGVPRGITCPMCFKTTQRLYNRSHVEIVKWLRANPEIETHIQALNNWLIQKQPQTASNYTQAEIIERIRETESKYDELVKDVAAINEELKILKSNQQDDTTINIRLSQLQQIFAMNQQSPCSRKRNKNEI